MEMMDEQERYAAGALPRELGTIAVWQAQEAQDTPSDTETTIDPSD